MIPLHPVIDHFTIALFAVAVIFEFIGRLLDKEGMRYAAWWNLFLASVAAIGSYLSGILLAQNQPHAEAAHSLMETHETLGLITMIIIVGLFLWRSFLSVEVMRKLNWLYLLLNVVGFSFLLLTGYAGGKLVYDYGAGVKPVIEWVESGKADGELGEWDVIRLERALQKELDDEAERRIKLMEETQGKSVENDSTAIDSVKAALEDSIKKESEKPEEESSKHHHEH